MRVGRGPGTPVHAVADTDESLRASEPSRERRGIVTGARGYFHYTGNMDGRSAAQSFAALSQESRLTLLRLLLSAGPTGLPAGEIAERAGLPASTTSFHLGALERAGLTYSARQSRQIIHAVRIEALRGLIAFLTETCCSGHPELCGDLSWPASDTPAKDGPAEDGLVSRASAGPTR